MKFLVLYRNKKTGIKNYCRDNEDKLLYFSSISKAKQHGISYNTPNHVVSVVAAEDDAHYSTGAIVYIFPPVASDRRYIDEATLLKRAIEWLEPQRRDGIRVLRICDRYAKGYSDLFIAVRGRLVVAEMKALNGRASPHQELFLSDMAGASVTGGICRSVKDVSDLIERAVKCQCGNVDSELEYCPYCGKENW